MLVRPAGRLVLGTWPAPGGDPAVIGLEFAGATGLTLSERGDLIFDLLAGSVVQRAPVIYQEQHGIRVHVDGHYRLTGDNSVAFDIAPYDRSLPLIIDPVLEYSTIFGTPADDWVHDVAVDAQGNVYVADSTNKRIQVFDNNGTFKTQYTNVGTPTALCITPGPNQFLYSSNSNPPQDFDVGGEIYKMKLDGTVVGKFGRAGKLPKEFGTVNAIDCRSENSLLVGEIANMRVQKLTLHP